MGTLSAGSARLRELLASRSAGKAVGGGGAFRTGYAALDALLPDDGLARGAVHEIIPADDRTPPLLFPFLLARAALRDGGGGAVVWSDPSATVYPPALAMMGMPMDRIFLLRVGKASDELWALAECLRCKGVVAAVSSPPRLSPVEARRLQLAAERGGGIGILIRRRGASAHYAAATRWVVGPVRGDAGVQRWGVELVHGHGRLTTTTTGRRAVVLEVCRGTHHVRAVDMLVDRPDLAPPAARATA